MDYEAAGRDLDQSLEATGSLSPEKQGDVRDHGEQNNMGLQPNVARSLQ